jgi:hypothetical protein
MSPKSDGKKMCKCGGTDHQRTSSYLCPLNKRNSKLKDTVVEKSCKCGSTEHQRTSHHLCPLNNPRESKIEYKPEDENYFYGKIFKTIKCKLFSFLKEPCLEEKIIEYSNYFGRISFYFSKVLQYEILKNLNNDIDFEISKNYLREIFDSVMENRYENKDLLKIPNFEQKKYISNIITRFVADYETILNNQYNERNITFLTNYYILEEYIKTKKMIKKYEAKKMIPENKIEKYNSFTITEKIKYCYKYHKKIIKMLEIFKEEIEEYNTKRDNLIKEYEKKTDKKSRKELSKKIKKLKPEIIKLIPKKRPFIPQYKFSPKFIFIDTNILFDLSRDFHNYKDTTKFGHDQRKNWLKFFRIEKYLNNNITSYNFKYSIRSDGYSVCISLIKRYLVKKVSEEEAKEREKQKKREKKEKENQIIYDEFLIEKDLDENIKYIIGIDPGRKNYVTCVRRNLETGEEQIKIFSTNRYYEECGFRHKTSFFRHKYEYKNIKEWMSLIPTIKTLDHNDIIKYLEYIQVHIGTLYKISFNNTIRKLNFSTYRLKQKTVDLMCNFITFFNMNSKNDTIIAFGDGDFNTSFGFRKASPKATLVSKRLSTVHEQNVSMVNEFNTSKVCSKCLLFEKLIDLKNNKNVNNHFVRSCPTCFTIWNRDVNSSRNMIELFLHEDRPKCFRKQIKD